MLDRLIAEATDIDFKVALEVKKPKSWLKSVSAFANGIGGVLLFGVDDDRQIVGIDHAQEDAETISRLIKERITPLPQFVLRGLHEKGKSLLSLEVAAGRSTPYYYKADGVTEAYIRVGNESIPAPDYVLNELILKGTNRSFDALVTDERREDYSFTLLEAAYRERTGLRFEPSDYFSFGLTDKNGFLTNAGRLLADQHIVYNSRIFCTRWNGLEKGSIFDDALDDGIRIRVISGYRSDDDQQMLREREISSNMGLGMDYLSAVRKTDKTLAPVGCSEHGTGLAADLCTWESDDVEPEFHRTAAGKWLCKRSSEYGFILRYPRFKEHITGIDYEPWHYRYVGRGAAKLISESGICLEEFLHFYSDKYTQC